MIGILRAALVMICLAAPAKAADLTVFAAASLTDAMAQLALTWEAETGQTVTLVLAGSSTLARQIDAGAPADVFVSANTAWMDWLADRGRVRPGTLQNIAANRLVLIAHEATAARDEELSEASDIASGLGPGGRLAIALPDAVPAGIYAKAALTYLGRWDGLRDRLAPTDNARAVLALVALGEAHFGIVYATDAKADPRVVVAGLFPASSHPAIHYPAAVIDRAGNAAAADFVAWLGGDVAQAILRGKGFLPPEQPE